MKWSNLGIFGWNEGKVCHLARRPSPLAFPRTAPRPDRGQAELTFLEIRRQFHCPTQPGWLAAILDLALSQGLLALHANPKFAWTLGVITRESALSRLALVTRFAVLLGTSPMRNLRDWRPYLAAQILRRLKGR